MKIIVHCREPYGKWTEEDMERALMALANGDMGLNGAARVYNVPKTTLRRRQKHENKFANNNLKRFGRSTVFSTEMEEELVQHVLKLETMFFGISRSELMSLAYQLAEANDVQHVFNKD